MTSDYCSFTAFTATRESHLLKMILYSRFLETVLAILILLFLASVHWVPMNSFLLLIALAALSGGLFSQSTYYLPSLLAIQINYSYIYDLLMTICSSLCVPLSTYCITNSTGDDNLSMLYIALALLYICLATSFLFSLITQYDFDPFGRNSKRSASKSNERLPLLTSFVSYGNYQVF